jgi:hypothetical protein
MKHHPMNALVAGLYLLSVSSLASPAATASATGSTPVATRTWADVANWPNFQGGIWLPQRGPRAAGSREAPEYVDAVAARLKAIGPIAPETLGNAFCEPNGGPFERTGEFFYSKDVIFIMNDEDWLSVRMIYMDGREHGDPDPSYYGHSVGHWEGDTLVIDTVGFLPQVTIAPKVPGNGATRATERFRLLDKNTLEQTVTFVNAEVLKKPYTTSMRYSLRRDLHVQEAECSQNNRDLPVNGEPHIDLTEPKSTR